MARFRTGDRVRTRAANPEGHTRLPRYLCDRQGTIEAVHGVFALPDERARGVELGNCKKETLDTVVFDGREVWAPTANEVGKSPVRLKEGPTVGARRKVLKVRADKKMADEPLGLAIVAPNPMRQTESGEGSAFCERAIMREAPRSAPERQGKLARTGSVHVGLRPGPHAVLGQESGDRALRERSLDPDAVECQNMRMYVEAHRAVRSLNRGHRPRMGASYAPQREKTFGSSTQRQAELFDEGADHLGAKHPVVPE